MEAELSHPVVGHFARRLVRKMFPDDHEMHLPGKPMRRHHYLYVRNLYLTDPAVLERIAALHRETSCEQAREVGLVNPQGPGSFTHPHLSRTLYADGKVITPLFKGRVGQTRTDKATGEIKQVRFEPDADLHFEGDGELAYGTKFVVVAARSGEARGRMILDVTGCRTRAARPRRRWAASSASHSLSRVRRASTTTPRSEAACKRRRSAIRRHRDLGVSVQHETKQSSAGASGADNEEHGP